MPALGPTQNEIIDVTVVPRWLRVLYGLGFALFTSWQVLELVDSSVWAIWTMVVVAPVYYWILLTGHRIERSSDGSVVIHRWRFGLKRRTLVVPAGDALALERGESEGYVKFPLLYLVGGGERLLLRAEGPFEVSRIAHALGVPNPDDAVRTVTNSRAAQPLRIDDGEPAVIESFVAHAPMRVWESFFVLFGVASFIAFLVAILAFFNSWSGVAAALGVCLIFASLRRSQWAVAVGGRELRVARGFFSCRLRVDGRTVPLRQSTDGAKRLFARLPEGAEIVALVPEDGGPRVYVDGVAVEAQRVGLSGWSSTIAIFLLMFTLWSVSADGGKSSMPFFWAVFAGLIPYVVFSQRLYLHLLCALQAGEGRVFRRTVDGHRVEVRASHVERQLFVDGVLFGMDRASLDAGTRLRAVFPNGRVVEADTYVADEGRLRVLFLVDDAPVRADLERLRGEVGGESDGRLSLGRVDGGELSALAPTLTVARQSEPERER